MVRKFLLLTLTISLLLLSVGSVYGGGVTLPHKISLKECKEEYFNWHNGTNISDCIYCDVCCDSNYPCIEWSWTELWSGASVKVTGTLNKKLHLYAAEVWIDCYDSVAGKDVSYIAFGYERSGRMYLYFSDGTTIECGGGDTRLCEFYISEDSVINYMNGEKYKEASITHGSEITRIELENTGWNGYYDIITQIPFAIDTPHDIPSIYSDFEIACIVSHTKQYPIENHTYELVIKHAGSGEIIDVRNITNQYQRFQYNLSNFTFDTYIVELRRDGSVMNTNWFVYYDALSGSSVNVEKDVYTPLETAKITYSIDNPDFSNHRYFLVIESVYGEEVFRQLLTKADGEIEVELKEFDPKFYIASLKRSSSSEILLAYDTFQVAEGVFVEGKTYDAESEEILPSVFVSYCQDYVGCKNTTSDAVNASYQIKDLAVDYEIQVNASKTNYTHNNFSFTPLRNGWYEINLFLLPDASHINVTAPAIVGLTQTYPFRQNVSYATVNIWNDTWSASTTTNSMGYFAFENLTPGTYYLNATRVKFKPSQTYEVNLSSGEIEYVYILMWEIYNLTIKARDAGTHSTIYNFKASLNDGEQVKETTIGKLNFSVEYGIHKVEVGADNYYSAIEYVYVYKDMEKVFYLTPLEEGITAAEQGVGISYPPHQVEFVCVDMFGNPLANIQVEATPISTTTGSWNWLLNLFGIRNESITYYTNQTLNGTTDSRGAITFVMMENVEYEVRFVNESLGISKTIRIHPKADHYTVILTPVTSSIVSSEDYITFNLSYEIGDDEITLSLVYNDTLAQTQNLTFFVYNSTSLLYQQNFTNVSNVNVSYAVPYKAGEEYMWGYSAFHSRFGEMGRSRILRIAWFLDLGISRTYCTWIAIAIILFLTAMFSFTTVKFGYVAIPMVSLIFAYIGWLPNISIIIIALCLGILAYMSKREKEVGV
ncbi:MAG: carboxypeptidase regulatory-like domain-containing protein [Candidatus Thorarchaeota archaeon]